MADMAQVINAAIETRMNPTLESARKGVGSSGGSGHSDLRSDRAGFQVADRLGFLPGVD